MGAASMVRRRLRHIAWALGVAAVAVGAIAYAAIGAATALALCASAIGVVAIAMWSDALRRSSEEARARTRLDERLLFELGDLLRTSTRSHEALAQVST